MNREQRRKQAREEKRNPNSKSNFTIGKNELFDVTTLGHNDNLKECDQELINLFVEVERWKIGGSVKSKMAIAIIATAMSYLDSLCSLRFDITPAQDKVHVRNAMYCIANAANYFIGLCSGGVDGSVSERIKVASKANYESVPFLLVQDEPVYDVNMKSFPEKSSVDDLYAGFVVEHADELMPLLFNAKVSDIGGDDKYVFKVLMMIMKKTRELSVEADAA